MSSRLYFTLSSQPAVRYWGGQEVILCGVKCVDCRRCCGYLYDNGSSVLDQLPGAQRTIFKVSECEGIESCITIHGRRGGLKKSRSTKMKFRATSPFSSYTLVQLLDLHNLVRPNSIQKIDTVPDVLETAW